MKQFLKNIPIRLRLTILMALILIVASIALMLSSIAAARNVYDIPFQRGVSVSDIRLKDGLKVEAPGPEAIVRPGPGPAAIRVQQNNDFAAAGVISAILVILAGTGLTYMMAGRALKPVTDLSDEIERIDENHLFLQVPVAPSNDEVSKLSSSFNHMIRKLESAFVSQKNFSANAAHELRTPLAAMIANIEVLQLEANPSVGEYKETMDDTLDNAQRLSRLVDDLLKMNAQLNIKAFDSFRAVTMFEQVKTELQGELEQKSLKIDIAAGDVLLYGDRPLLHRAFANLVHNAIKYNKEEGAITIAAADAGEHVRITIFDTGIGVPADELDRIFDPFYCVDKSRSREQGGSGLGLSIVKSVIEKHGGEIKVQSEMGVYTSITITLPKR